MAPLVHGIRDGHLHLHAAGSENAGRLIVGEAGSGFSCCCGGSPEPELACAQTLPLASPPDVHSDAFRISGSGSITYTEFNGLTRTGEGSFDEVVPASGGYQFATFDSPATQYNSERPGGSAYYLEEGGQFNRPGYSRVSMGAGMSWFGDNEQGNLDGANQRARIGISINIRLDIGSNGTPRHDYVYRLSVEFDRSGVPTITSQNPSGTHLLTGGAGCLVLAIGEGEAAFTRESTAYGPAFTADITARLQYRMELLRGFGRRELTID